MRRGRVLLAHQASSRLVEERRSEADNSGGDRNIGSNESSPEKSSEQQQEQQQRTEDVQRAPIVVGRGRAGRLLSQMAALNLGGRNAPQQQQQTVQQPGQEDQQVAEQQTTTKTSSAPSTNGSVVEADNSGSGQKSRRGSNASSTSVLSQQFAKIEQKPKSVLPKVPSTGGQSVDLSLNYMTFKIEDGTSVEEYHVNFFPEIESIKLRYSILRSDIGKQTIGNVMHWTGTNLYLPKRLAKRVTEFSSKHPATDEEVRVKLTWVKTPPDTELLQFYNSLMHKVMVRLKYVVINRHHYSPLHRIAIEQHKLEVWPGWVTSIQRLDGGIKLAVDASFKVLRLETVRDIMVEMFTRCRGSNMKEALESELVGAIVMTRYNNRPYRIDAIDITKKPTDTFRQGDKDVSYVEYLKQHWNIEVKDLNQPMIVNQPKPRRGEMEAEPVLLVPELCVTTGLTDSMRANYSTMKAIADYTRLPPKNREEKLVEFLQQLSTDERATSVLKDWNLEVQPQLDIVSGRRLDTESVMFGDNRTHKAQDNVDWTRPATTGSVYRSVDITDWVIMHTERDFQIASDFMSSLKDVSRLLNIKFSAPRIVKLQNDSPASYVNAGKKEVRLTDQMIVILTPGKGQREDRYSACKRLYSCEIPVPCQFIRSGNISNPGKLRSIVQKIVIQILAKCGGAPWAMKFPIKSFMIVGIDVYHDTIDRKKSCVGFVASVNDTASRWWSQTFFQNSLEEISQKLNTTMVTALKKFHQINGFVPQKVIIYRDGVGDGQLETVLQVEVAQVLNSIMYYMRDNHSEAPTPQLSYIVVQKRINAKLSLRSGRGVSNPLPGTYLDHTITHPEYNDFYLVSQHVNQGTVSPTKYIVVNETGNLKMEHHQKLAYKMTYMYYNWCGTIRVPAPCQYAHKLAYLTGQNIRQQANEKLQDKLYYL